MLRVTWVTDIVTNRQRISLGLNLEDIPLSRGVIRAMRQERITTQARWSGHALCVSLKGFHLPHTDATNAEFRRGDVIVHLGSPQELVLCYGPVVYYVHPNGDEGCVRIGSVWREDFQDLTRLGEIVWKQGAKQSWIANLRER